MKWFENTNTQIANFVESCSSQNIQMITPKIAWIRVDILHTVSSYLLNIIKTIQLKNKLSFKT